MSCIVAELQITIRKECTMPRSKPLRPPAPPEALTHYHRLVALLADRVRSVARGYQTGAYLVGRPGGGKTHTVCRALEEDGVDFVLVNGRLSPAALFDAFEERPDSVHVIDDVPLLFSNQQAAQILMAAVGGDPRVPRRVTYLTRGSRRVVEVTGGLIAISNRPLSHDPAGRALASRMAILEHEPTDDMLVAFMRDQATRGLKDVPADESMEVCEHVISECRAADYRIDLRYFYKAIEDYRCWKSGACATEWRVLVKSAMRRVVAEELPPAPLTRAGTKATEYEVVRELHGQDLSREALGAAWREKTGKGMDSYYRRRRELGLR
jgi:hypothetical protein